MLLLLSYIFMNIKSNTLCYECFRQSVDADNTRQSLHCSSTSALKRNCTPGFAVGLLQAHRRSREFNMCTFQESAD